MFNVVYAIKYPKIKYHIYSDSIIEVLDKLNKTLLNFGISVEPVDLDKYNI